MNIQDIIYSISIIGLGFFIVSTQKKSLSKKDIKTLYIIWIFHILMSIAYFMYINANGGDAMMYWNDAKQMNHGDFISSIFNEQGTYFMIAFNYIFANILGMSFFSNSLVYGLLGFVGIFYFYIICLNYIPRNSKFYKFKLFPLLFFLPNLHFWSSGIGKDTILFLCIALFAYGILKIKKRFPLIIIALLLSLGIRPHITLIMLIGFSLAYLSISKFSKPQQIFMTILLIAASAYVLPKALEFSKIENTSVKSFENFSEQQAIGLSEAGSVVDIASYPYPLKIFTFLYRPFFFDINGIPALIASFENLLLLLLSIQVIRSKPIQTFRKAPLVIRGLFIMSMLGVFVFSMGMSNLGIILRMRNMFLPGIIIYILWSLSYKQELALKKRK